MVWALIRPIKPTVFLGLRVLFCYRPLSFTLKAIYFLYTSLTTQVAYS
jgi:hypothetical protein